ncbi:hypothetical protein [Streptacidiphilus sp. EB103A]|uniref:hypothetical protein n=1 Tax=Streptacidiphilus sp. EB103A TaxID=3156275 RepID=UPI003516346D
MQHYKHPLATHAAMTVLGYRRNGAPIHAIAGGATPPEPTPVVTPPVAPPVITPPVPTPPVVTPPTPPAPDSTDWKAEARKWEARAKENGTAKTELEKIQQAAMTEQEKAVAAAKAEGRTAAEAEARTAAVELAVFRSAAKAGADPEALLDSRTFLNALADVDPKDTAAVTKAINDAVKANPKLAAAAAAPGASGPPIPGGPDGQRTRPTSLGAALGAHYGQ